MILRELSLLHFRNYAQIHHRFEPGLNVIVGENAQGKSNLLEASGVLATSKSIRGARDIEMIAWDQKSALVSGNVRRDATYDVELEVGFTRSEGKTLSLNRSPVPRVTDFVGQVKSVSFCASDLDIVRGEPARRRRFLDLEISQTSPAYCHALGSYVRVLDQRTRLLKSLRDRPSASVATGALAEWTDQLVRFGSILVERRSAFVEQLEELARPIHSRMTDGREYLGLIYHCSFALPQQRTRDEIARAFSETLAACRDDERRRGLTLVGPHRDNLSFLFDGHDGRIYGSQAQQRTILLSTRLGEMELMKEAAAEEPICLLDDVLSELDEHRRGHLFETLGSERQVLLTCTELGALPPDVVRSATVHSVRDAVVERSH